MQANKRQKEILLGFWNKFGRAQKGWCEFSAEDKLSSLIDLSNIKIQFNKQQSLEIRRSKFADCIRMKHYKKCFVCEEPKQARHHIILLRNGGVNSKKNVVPICNNCHKKIHPWMK